MNAIAIARKFVALGALKEAMDAYELALKTGCDPQERLEAAVFILQNDGDYHIAYTVFLELYTQGFFREDVLALMTGAFYEPNVKQLKVHYERNCRLLAKYPYLFRKDFPTFDSLPIRFYPYDDNAWIPFHVGEARFDGLANVKNQVISRNFFKDLEKPVLAEDVFSQYELEYLNDNVRRSEYVARENHVYLHYTDWETFCSWLQVLNMRPLLKEKKLVFLIGDEINQYPIDFKERFGIDYSQYTVEPIHIWEINRVIWHTQLSTHNGGDFFNEIFDGHPNLICMPSVMFSNIEETVGKLREGLKSMKSPREAQARIQGLSPRLAAELYSLPRRTDKDIMVTMYLNEANATCGLDSGSRIVPALFFQPHFANVYCSIKDCQKGFAMTASETLDAIHRSGLLDSFRYIKTFTPIRRPTTSHAATVRYMYYMSQKVGKQADGSYMIVADEVTSRVLNRTFMADPEERLYRDSVLVRFEDGKLNPKATFTALATFLDLPYTESMTCCTEGGKPIGIGFDPVKVYQTYDEYANEREWYFIEYFLRDVYEQYGYSFKYYDGAPVDEERIMELIQGFDTIDFYMRETIGKAYRSDEDTSSCWEQFLEKIMDVVKEHRMEAAKILLNKPAFVNKNGQPLRFITQLALDPALLEQPIYH